MSGHFITGRAGEKIRLNTPEFYKPNRAQRRALDLNRVVGLDTETIMRDGEPILKYLQMYVGEENKHCLDIEKKNCLHALFDFLITTYGQPYDKTSSLKQRSKEDRKQREGATGGRDGRRQTLQPVLLAFFNMPYDIGRILDCEEVFKRFVLFGQDCFSFGWKEYEIEIVYSVIDGGSPSFQWIIKLPDKKLAVRVYGFDGSNYFKCALKDAAKSLSSMGVPPKIDQDKDIFVRDWKKNKPTKVEIKEFMEYATRDAQIHKELYRCLVELLTDIDPCVLNKQGMIGMSAGATAWRMIINQCTEEKIPSPPDHFQEMGYKAYYGGISFCLKKGELERVSILDISSAYSHAASMIPAFETCTYKTHDSEKVDKTFKSMMWGIACVSGEGLDDLYPPLVCIADGRQIGIVGTFTRHWCSIPELHIGIARGALRVDRVHYCYELVGANEGAYKRFIEKMFAIKDSNPKNSPMYNMAKLMLNSPTGKIVEKRKSCYSVPRVVNGMTTEVYDITDNTFKKLCKQTYVEEGFKAVYDLHEAYLIDHAMLNADDCPEQIYLDAWFDDKIYDSGSYFNATLAANILGFTRAKLMAGASIVGAIQGDTDSLFFQGERPSDFVRRMNSWGAVTPEVGLGSFDVEADGLKGTFVKKKLYTVEEPIYSIVETREEVCQIVKSGHHTMHKVAGVEDQKIAHLELQRDLLERGEARYVGAPKPVKMREAWKRGITCGEFVSHIMSLKLEAPPFHTEKEDGLLHILPLEEILACLKTSKKNK